MPSDARVAAALEALRRPIAAYRSAVVSAGERVRALLSAEGGAERARLELGAFGGTRIDAMRFAELSRGVALDPLSRARLERAAVVLDELARAGDAALFVVDVPSGDSLRVAAARALARLGRAFGAMATAELVHAGRYEPERHDRLLEALPFEAWGKAERKLAPPLVVTVDGADLRAGSLAELLDGAARLVLIVRGPSAPAPLVRLLTPSTLVVQSRETSALARLEAWEGPAVAALLEQDAAVFTHDPAAGGALWQRLAIAHRPSAEPRRTLGGISPRQQREEMRQLEAMAERPALPTAPVEALVASSVGDGAASAGGDPAERLATWLLAESGLAGAS